MLDQRGQLLRAAVGFAGLPRPLYDRSLWALRTWLDSWSGIGHVAVGMHRQGFDLRLTQYDERGWRATFYTTGMEHSPTSATGTAWERTPWHATRRAAWEALTNHDEGTDDERWETWVRFSTFSLRVGWAFGLSRRSSRNQATSLIFATLARGPQATAREHSFQDFILAIEERRATDFTSVTLLGSP